MLERSPWGGHLTAWHDAHTRTHDATLVSSSAAAHATVLPPDARMDGTKDAAGFVDAVGHLLLRERQHGRAAEADKATGWPRPRHARLPLSVHS